MTTPVTIALVWHQMNSDNLGVGALTLANIALLREAAADAGLKPHFLILGWRDPRPDYETAPDIEPVPLRTRHLPAPGGPLGAAYARADLVVDIGGGDSFTDIYGTKRFLTVWGTKARAQLTGLPVVLAPQTIGPFNAAWTRMLARRVMNRSRAVVTRDAPSTAFLAEMGVKTDILEVTDVAMGLPYDPPKPREGGPMRVGLNVSGLLMNGGYTGENQFGLSIDYPTLIRDLVAEMVAREDVELHLIGHVQSEEQPWEDDQRAGEALAEEFPGAIVAPVFNSPIEAKSYIAGMDFVAAARMHAAIAAFSSGVPVVPMAYSRKFIGVFGTLGYNHVADMKADGAEDILGRIRQGISERAVLAADVAHGMDLVEDRLAAYRALAAREMRAACGKD